MESQEQSSSMKSLASIDKATVLVTKKMTLAQQELLLNAGLGYVSYNFIEITPLTVDIKSLKEAVILTSKHATQIVLASFSVEELPKIKVFCVGESSAKLCEEKGVKVVEVATNAAELAEIIIKQYADQDFQFFCGDKRRNELPERLKEASIKLEEVIVYKTEWRSKKIERFFDGILFFSPSAVTSFVQENRLKNQIAFCIGVTTATEAKKYTDKIVVANKPTIENVIVQAIKHFNTQERG